MLSSELEILYENISTTYHGRNSGVIDLSSDVDDEHGASGILEKVNDKLDTDELIPDNPVPDKPEAKSPEIHDVKPTDKDSVNSFANTDGFACPKCDEPDEVDDMINCDDCGNWFHYACVGIRDVPLGNWYCEKCDV